MSFAHWLQQSKHAPFKATVFQPIIITGCHHMFEHLRSVSRLLSGVEKYIDRK